jgi:hypothetical protein
MRSHTVPKRLLEQFAYDDPRTGVKQLWRYSKDLPPYWRQSPTGATRIDRHFSDPDDAAKEAEIESRLNSQVENPVNQFLSEICMPEFVANDTQRRQLTFYIQLLFHRSEARRKASVHLQGVSVQAMQSFVENERQVLTVAAKWNIDYLLGGGDGTGLFTESDVRAMRNRYDRIPVEIRAQSCYIRTIEVFMAEVDSSLLDGHWSFIRTSLQNPFIISDAPVVTWERMNDGQFKYGVGFHEPNVEAFVPFSPEVCLHIQPSVERTKPAILPSVEEINTAQAAFAGRSCFANINSPVIDRMFQENFGRAQLGVKGFTVWHRDYSTAVYDYLMSVPSPMK